MIITPTTKSIPVNTVSSQSPFYVQLYDPSSKGLLGKIRYMERGTVTSPHGILACDSYASLQAEFSSLGLVGAISTDPTPKAASHK